MAHLESTLQGVTPKDKNLVLSKVYLMTPYDWKFDSWLKSYWNFYIIGFLGGVLYESTLEGYSQRQSFMIW